MTPPAPDPGWTAVAEHHVTDPAAVEVLWHPTKRVHLKPFLGRSAGLAEAAQQLNIKKTAMSYWIGRLLQVGLIRPVGHQRRGRQAVPCYRCVGDRLRVALTDAPLSSYEGVFDDFDARWHPQTRRALARSIARQAAHIDLRIEARNGEMAADLVPRDENGPADDYLYCRGRLWLDDALREQLRGELDALWDRYVALSDPAGRHRATLVHVVVVPEARR